MSDLTKQDVDTLIDAVGAWELETSRRERLEAEMDAERARRGRRVTRSAEQVEADALRRRDRSVLLRAKLIALRDSMTADALLNEGK